MEVSLAARRNDDLDPAGDLPVAPTDRPMVLAAARLLERAHGALDSAMAVQADAVAAFEYVRSAEPEAALAAIESGQELPSLDLELVKAVEIAAHRVAQAEAAVELARAQHQKILAQARQDFSDEIKPLLIEAVAEAAAAALDAALLNDRVRQIAGYGVDHDAPGLPAVYEVALRLPSHDQIEGQIAARRSIFAEAEPAAVPVGRVLIKWLADITPYRAGEQAAIAQAEAVLQVRAGNASLVHAEQAEDLDLTNLIQLTSPAMVRMIRDFTPVFGTIVPAGTQQVFDAATASRLVNLGYAELCDDPSA